MCPMTCFNLNGCNCINTVIFGERLSEILTKCCLPFCMCVPYCFSSIMSWLGCDLGMDFNATGGVGDIA